MDQVKFYKGCLPHILLGPVLNPLTHLLLSLWKNYHSNTSKTHGADGGEIDYALTFYHC